MTYLNQYTSELQSLIQSESGEEASRAVQQHLYQLCEDELELLLLNALSLVPGLRQEESQVRERMLLMQKRIDEGEHIMNICKYHMYYVMGPTKLLTAELCKEIMKELPVRVQSQDPRLLYTAIIHGYHITHLLE